MKTIEQTIRAIAEKKGIKQSVLADELGITQAGLSKLLCNENLLKFKYLLKFAEIFDMRPIDVLTYPDVYTADSDTVLCRKCNEKDRIIENLNDLIAKYRADIKKLKTNG